MYGDLISVIIPAFNVKAYISQCIESITSQSYANLEVLIVNDGSTDTTPQIIDDLTKKDARLRVFHKTNGGASSARNLGLDNATGKYIMFVDGDDIIEPDSIQLLYSNLRANKSDISEGFSYTFETIDKKVPYLFNSRGPAQDIITSKMAFEYILRFRLNTSIWGKLYKASILNDVRFPEGRTFNEDFYFLTDLYKKNLKISLLRELVYGYRENPNSVTNVFNNRNFELLSFIEILRDTINHEDKRLVDALGVYENVINANLFITMKRNGVSQQFPVEYRKLKQHVRQHWYSYLFGRDYSLKDRVKMLLAFL